MGKSVGYLICEHVEPREHAKTIVGVTTHTAAHTYWGGSLDAPTEAHARAIEQLLKRGRFDETGRVWLASDGKEAETSDAERLNRELEQANAALRAENERLTSELEVERYAEYGNQSAHENGGR